MQSRSIPLFVALVAVLALVGVSVTGASAQQLTKVSVATDGTVGNQGGTNGTFSGNGRFVAFVSSSTNLVTGDTNASRDVFVRDLQLLTTQRVSVTSTGAEKSGDSGMLLDLGLENGRDSLSLSADGSLVAFSSRAPLVDTDTNSCTVDGQAANCSDIYVHSRTTGTTERVSLSSNGAQANGESFDPHLSADGRYVVFTSSASNLVFGDQNGLDDVFLHDRVAHTTIRISTSPSNNDLSARSFSPRISGDGQIIVFLSLAPEIDPAADPLPCTAGGVDPCVRAFIFNRATNRATRIAIPAAAREGFGLPGGTVDTLAFTSDGRSVAMSLGPAGGRTVNGQQVALPVTLAILDRQLNRLEYQQVNSQRSMITMSDNGRLVAIRDGAIAFTTGLTPPRWIDRLANYSVTVPPSPGGLNPPSFTGTFSADGLNVLFTDGGTLYLYDRDVDGDGMPDDWETTFGLNPASAADAGLDPDADGQTSLQEYQAGTNPIATFKRYFAEGAANAFFSTRFAVFNPNDTAATVSFELLGENQQARSTSFTLAAHARALVPLNQATALQPDGSFSTIVEADKPVVADRTMTWDQTGYGSHAETAIEAPGMTWYLAEGSTGGSFDLFYLLQNPGALDAHVTINYLLPAPAAPIAKTYLLPARSRLTVYVDQEGAALSATDVSAKITADQPILAERAMYFSVPGQPFAAGHEGAAVSAPAPSWFFAEGATGSFFDLFLLLANADTTDANVQITYLLPIGAPIVKNYTVPAQSRVTINVDFEDPALRDTPVSAIVESKNGVPIIAERAMWWPSPNWYEAHLSAGATTTGTKWALADGFVSRESSKEAETYVLIANTSNTAGTADVTVYVDTGGTVTKTFAIPANSRVNVQVSAEFPTLTSAGRISSNFSTVVQSSGPAIVVERAMYSNANGQVWAAGTDALATKLQ